MSLAGTSAAVAAPSGNPEVLQARKRAEAQEKSRDWEGCGSTYRDIVAAHPNDSAAPEVLYNAGVCFERGKSVGLALQMYSTLRRRFPRSRLSQRALVRAANLHASTASFERAAALYEQYATTYSGEKDASQALSYAVAYRRGLGQFGRAIADIELFVRTYGRKLERDAAAAYFTVVGLHGAQGKPRKAAVALERYLKRHGRAGGRERIVIALAKLGELAWQASCPLKVAPNGSCVRIRSTGKKYSVVPVSRNERRVRKARRYFRRAVRAGRRLRRSGTRSRWGARDRAHLLAQAHYWLGAAHFYLADASVESLFADDKVPAARLAKEIARLAAAGQATTPASPPWRIAGAARTGQLYLHQGQEAKAKAAFQSCLDLSIRSSSFTDFSRMCESELQRLQPEITPPLSELRGRPAVRPILTRPTLLPDPR